MTYTSWKYAISYLQLELKNSTNIIFQEAGKDCIAYGSFDNGFERARSDQLFAMSEGRDFLQYSIRSLFTDMHGKSSKHIMEECHLMYQVAFLLPIGSIYKAKFSSQIIRIAEAGLRDKYYNDELDKVAVLTKENKKSNPVSLTLHHLQGIFKAHFSAIYFS
jgi:hypothetical protein